MNDSTLSELLAGAQFSMSYAEKRRILLPLLQARAQECAIAHPGLAAYGRQMGFATDPAADYDQLPYLPVGMFKTFDLATVPPADIVRTLLSSATTGANPSRIPLDKVTGKRQARGLAAILKDQLGGKRRPLLVLDVPEINAPGSQLGARGAAVRGIMPFAASVTYALQKNGDGFALDLAAVRDFFERHHDEDVLVFGFTYLVWTEIVQRLRAIGETFDHPRLTLLHSGGWKKLTEQEVDKAVFAAGVAEVFGCPLDQVRDFYGMVEQVGVVFVDCEAGHKHSPAFAEVAIRDFATLRQVDVGGTGLIQVMSLLPGSYPGHALLTEDVGQVLGYDDCPCGRGGMYFRFRSRVHQVEVRGCGDTVAASRIRETAPVRTPAPQMPAADVRCLGGVPLPAGDDFPSRFDTLRTGLSAPTALDGLPVAATVGLLGDVAGRLLSPELAGIEGLAFLSAWLQPNNLARVLRTNFGARLAALDGPVPDAGSALVAAPRGVVGHWVAGNVPTLALFSWALATLAGNRSIVRVSRESVAAAEQLFAAIGAARFDWEGKELSGADLMARTSVLHFDSGHRGLNAAMSRVCDARCIWGGSDAVAAVRDLPVYDHTEDLVFGPKFSVAVVDRAELADPERAAALATTIAREVAVFDQAACSSPQILYLAGTIGEHEGWLTALHEAMAAVQRKSSRPAVTETAAADIVRLRATYGLTPERRVWASTGTEHTLLAGDGAELVPAVQARTLFVRAVPDLLDIVTLLTPKIQTIGVAIADADLRATFCAAAARQGVSRCVPLGTMNFFETPWDGMLPLSRLVRWVRVPAVQEPT